MVDTHGKGAGIKMEYDPYEIDITDLVLYLNDYCNMNCRHCYYRQGNHTIDTRWIQEAVDNLPNIKKAVIVGGEPTICPVLEEAVDILKSKNIAVTMSTNCKWMTWGKQEKNTGGTNNEQEYWQTKKREEEDHMKQGERKRSYTDVLDMIKNIDVIQISLEGPPQINDSIREEGSYMNSMDAIDFLKQNGYEKYPESTRKGYTGKRMFIRMTYSEFNLRAIPRMLRLAWIKHLPIVFFPLKSDTQPPLTSTQQVQLYNLLMKYSTDDGRRLAMSAVPQYWTYMGDTESYCPAGKHRINILPDGWVTPCEMNMPPIFDKLYNMEKNNGELDIDKLYRNIDYFLRNIKTVDDGCINCPHHRICRSGCLMTNEYLKCPLREQIDFSYFGDRIGVSTGQRMKRVGQLNTIIERAFVC